MKWRSQNNQNLRRGRRKHFWEKQKQKIKNKKQKENKKNRVRCDVVMHEML